MKVITSDESLTSVANAIRGITGGEDLLEFPGEFVSELDQYNVRHIATLSETRAIINEYGGNTP